MTSNNHAEPITRWLAWMGLAFAIYSLIFCRIVFFPLATFVDTSLYLQCGQLILEGKIPYVDFIDINPPMIMYLNTLPVAIARATGQNPILVFQLLVWALGVWSAWMGYRIIRRAFPEFDLPLLALLLFAWGTFSLLLFSPIDEQVTFGQREHLFMLGFFPLLLVRWARWQGRPVGWSAALASGLAAGVGTCLKPHFFLILLLPELYGLIRYRNWRSLVAPELLGYGSAGFAYLIHFFFVPAPMREAFLDRWMPLISQNYSTFNRRFIRMIDRTSINFAIVITVVAFVLRWPESDEQRLARPLSWMTLAGILVFYSQHKGWPYHAIPALGGMMLLLALMTRRISRSWPLAFTSRATRLLLPLGWGIVTLALVASFARVAMGLPHSIPDGKNRLTKTVAEHSSPGDPVMIINTSLQPAYPMLVQMNRRPGSRYLWAFPLPMFYNGVLPDAQGHYAYRSREQIGPQEALYLDEMAEDIAKIRPRLVLVRDGRKYLGFKIGFNLMEYFEHVGFIQTALQNYELLPDRSHGYFVFVPRGAVSIPNPS